MMEIAKIVDDGGIKVVLNDPVQFLAERHSPALVLEFYLTAMTGLVMAMYEVLEAVMEEDNDG